MWDVEQDEQGNWWTTVADEKFENLGPDGEDTAKWRAEVENDKIDEERRLDGLEPYPGFYY